VAASVVSDVCAVVLLSVLSASFPEVLLAGMDGTEESDDCFLHDVPKTDVSTMAMTRTMERELRFILSCPSCYFYV
jgi:hypothetical protein